VIVHNTVTGYRANAPGTTGEGFGIVVEGLNETVTDNIVDNNDVGIQMQAGNPAINAQSTLYFDRGNATNASGSVCCNQILMSNTVGLRTVGTLSSPTNFTYNWWGSSSGPAAGQALAFDSTGAPLAPPVVTPFLLTPDCVASFQVTVTPTTVSTGQAFTVTITALRPASIGGGTDTYFAGTVNFSSSDSRLAGLPTSYTFQPGDMGVKTFTGVTFGTSGTQTLTATDAAASSITGTVTVQVTATAPPAVPSIIVTGAGPGGGPQVNVFNADGSVRSRFLAYGSTFTGGVRVAVGDVNGDGIPDVVTGARPGGGPQVRVFDGKTFQPLPGKLGSFYGIFTSDGKSSFTGGIYVAVGDVNGDGFADVIVGADAGGGPQVNVFSGKDGSLLASFHALAASFTGGVRVAAGDLNGDGFADIIVSAGPGGGPQVTIFDGKTLRALTSFYAMPAGFTGGVFVSAGDLNGDGRADIIAGAGAGAQPQVSTFDGPTQKPLTSFYGLPSTFTGGVLVGYERTAGNGRPAILASAGPGGGPQVVAFDAATLANLGAFFALPSSFPGGVFVAGS
jgi:hypothetical protein